MGKKEGKFCCQIESEESMRNFRSKYRIPSTVGMRYTAQGEWADARQIGEVVIPMIAFTEGGMTIPWVKLLGATLGSLGYPQLSVP